MILGAYVINVPRGAGARLHQHCTKVLGPNCLEILSVFQCVGGSIPPASTITVKVLITYKGDFDSRTTRGQNHVSRSRIRAALVMVAVASFA